MWFTFPQSVLPENRWTIGLWMGLLVFGPVLVGCNSEGSGMEEPLNTLTHVLSDTHQV
ncbi:hypothetical protein GGP50_002527 [Salinibacter ruber]|nr:hypothetical protein [Salinibacter ruber]MCS4174221.1 hypothetical protein [Salinibacter ruber]MCS4194302.1 hypothetical protein [Salinibacter ruber]